VREDETEVDPAMQEILGSFVGRVAVSNEANDAEKILFMCFAL
jgi:hypothetical protein